MRVTVYGTESENRELIKAFAELPNCCYRNIQITGFSDYDSFIAGLKENPPQFIVITMNGANGMEGVIAAKNLFENVPVIWFSDDKDFGVQSYRLGCAYFHEKPVLPEVLSTAIAKCV